MSVARSLKSQLTWWFAAALLALYGTTAVLGWFYARTTARQYALLALKQEVEQAVAYIAESGRFDAAEFDRAEDEPIPLWMRAIRGGRVIKASPGAPGIPVLPSGDEDTVSTRTFRHEGVPYMVVHHRVGGGRDLSVEALGSLTPLLKRERQLGGALVLAGVLLIPLAALGGRRLAGRALAPVEHLVGSIRELDPAARDERLATPPHAVREVEILADAFNDLLARLQDTVESMRRFTADASHEIRNPLSVVRSGLEIALRRERTPAQYRTLMRENLQEIERLQTVLEGLLAMTRSAPGAPVPARRDPTDLSQVVARTAAGFETVAAEREVALRLAVEPGVTVEGDAALLRLIVFNLVDNALKHGPRGAPIEIALARDGDAARLCVADSGAGVPPEVRSRLFERFNRGADAGASGGVGGLGLSVVRWVAELHGGGVRLVEPEAGAGARFEVRLPLAAPDRAEARR